MSHQTGSHAARIASWLLALCGIGEVAVGLAILAFPGPAMGLLLEATLVGISLVIARLFGIAIIALGITWWLMRGDVSRQLRMAPGFIIYNLGVGALVLVYALEAASPVPISWAVALAHLLAGFGSSATLVMRSRPAGSGMARPSPVVAPVDVKRRVR